MFYVDLNFVPVWRQTEQRFSAPDPWAANQPATWHLNAYQFETRTSRPLYPLEPGKAVQPLHAIFYGIHSPDHKRYRILPLALQDLWSSDRLPVGEIPWILHRIESALPLSAYPPPLLRQYLRTLSLVFTLLTLALLGFYAWVAIGNVFEDAYPLLYAALAVALCTGVVLGLLRLHETKRRTLAVRVLEMLAERHAAGAAV